jgi:cell division protein FtsQ
MLKRINWMPVFKCFAWIVCLAGLVVLMSFVEAKKKTVVCTKVKILIPGADNFIEREEIDAILKHSEGALVGRNLAAINLQHIEKSIIANPYIAYATVYADMNGVIQIEVRQRQPVLRVINAAGQDYYIDSNGLKMPVSPNFTANVLAANGSIMEHFSGKVDTLITKLAVDLYKVALYVKKDTLWDAQIEQLFVNNTKDIEMIPRLGNQRIILGNADSLETKMRNLRVFYKKAMPKVGWNTYKTINVKYTNQVVCEKNKIDSLTGEVINVPGEKVKQNHKSIDSVVRSAIEMDIAEEESGGITANSKQQKVKTDTRKNN